MGNGDRLHRAVGDQMPPDPVSLASREHLQESVRKLSKWFEGKSSVLCLTGAGISTESGIPDYRGHGGSYRLGHKPMVHDQFISSEGMRRRYWGRAMVGWRDFANASPNEGHTALARLEAMGKIGVAFPDDPTYHCPITTDTNGSGSRTMVEDKDDHHSYGQLRQMSVLTQNVDGLHRKAATKHFTELHGRNDRVRCTTCGTYRSRYDFHDELERKNPTWLDENTAAATDDSSTRGRLRPDGDADTTRTSYSTVHVPPCQTCGSGFVKPDVVFFGDVVPKHTVELCYGAVRAADGLLCIGSSLAVHSAYRFVQRASEQGVEICVLNVGDTRAEVRGLDVTKVEAPAGPALGELVKYFEDGDVGVGVV